jgi:large subunit ribosomal protein L29
MKYQDVKDLSVTELKKKKQALTQEMFDAKMKNSLGQLANPLEIRALRRQIARLNTALVQKVVR